MAKIINLRVKQCPICKFSYTSPSAVSRVDNKTEICPKCGIRQALESIGIVNVDDQNHILDLIANYERRMRQ